MNTKKLNALIATIGRNTAETKENVQRALIGCTEQVILHGNTEPFNNLLKTCVEGRIALRGVTLWAETFGFVRVKEEQFVANKGAPKSFDPDNLVQHIQECSQVKWYDMVAPEKADSIFDAREYTIKAIERVAKKLNAEGAPDLSKEVQKIMAELVTTEAWKSMAPVN